MDYLLEEAGLYENQAQISWSRCICSLDFGY